MPAKWQSKELSAKHPPRVAAIVPSTIASCQIGVLKPLSALAHQHQIQLRHTLESRASLALVHWADVVVFCRNTEPAYAHLLSEALSTHKPIVFDLDDNFWDVPFDSDPELARYHRLPLRLQQLEKYLRHATLVRVYSPNLRDIVSGFNANVRLLKAGFDFDLVGSHPRPKPKGNMVQIVYATSRIVDNQYVLFAEALKKILQIHQNNVQVTIWGCQPADLVGIKNIKFEPLIANYEKFLRLFASANFDIGLAPLEDTPFHRSKTNTKFRDYGASQVAGVYSDVSVYSSCVEQGSTGILVENTTESWFEGINRLIQDPKLRLDIQAKAYAQVYKEFRQDVIETEWLSQIQELLAESISYSLQAGSTSATVKEILIRSDLRGLSGITFPAQSPGDHEPVPKVALEILTASGNLVREASAITIDRHESAKEIAVSFAPIINSEFQEFLLRFISLPEEIDGGQPSWLPSSAFISMNYSRTTD